MQFEKAFARLVEMDRQLVLIEHMEAVLSWDQETGISDRGAEERALQMGWISSRYHELACGQEMGDVLSALGASAERMEGAGRDAFEKALIRIRFRTWYRKRTMPLALVQELGESISRARGSWEEARNQDDWSLFSRDLSHLLDLTREKASCLTDDPVRYYDVLLDEYEEGMTADYVERLFEDMKGPLQALLAREADRTVDDAFLYRRYPVEAQDAFAVRILTDMGFDFSRGRRALSVHPFTSTLGEDDIRITTRYTDPSVTDGFLSSIHEGGHALYEMGASSGRLKGTSVANGASMGMHESQSRLWENMVARSPEFWEYYLPVFKQYCPSQLEGVGVNRFVKAINKVVPSTIRTNADEVSYSLHIMLRFDLERAMIAGTLPVDDVPAAWNEASSRLLGIVVPTVREGALQDVHWSGGDFGYFPTYALGNLYGAQIWEAMGESLDVPTLLRQGKLSELSSYLNEHIHSLGALYKPLDLLERATGKPLDATLFPRYLEGKFDRLYGR